MTVYTVPAGILRANCYLLTADAKNAVLIDCGGNEPFAFAEKKGLKIGHVLLTHGHYDHIAGCARARALGIPVGCAEAERATLCGSGNLAAMFGADVGRFEPDFTFSDGDALSLDGLCLHVIATPGHTPGGVCFLCGNDLFTGDTLFLESVGRTDFPGGSGAQLRNSVHRLFALEGDCKVWPGHDDPTTLGHERKYNPFR